MPEWEEMHKEDNRPWDLNGITPILKFFVEFEYERLSHVKRICVPGCGQKNDSEYLAKSFKGAKVIGVDISPTAVKKCTDSFDKSLSNLQFIEADFFKEDFGTFDLVFDHTFFCAINPDMRSDWGKKMASITNEYLLTLIYPLPRDPENQVAGLSTGPPFEVTFDAYERVLKDAFECVKRWSTDSLPSSNEKRKGKEQLALWKRK